MTMIDDLPGVKDASEPLPLSASGTAVALVIAIPYGFLEGHNLPRRTPDKVSPSQETALAAEDTLRNILKVEARERGFTICGGQAYRRPYRLSGGALGASIEPALKRAANRPRPDTSGAT